MFNIPRIKEMIEETHKLYDNQTVIDHYNRGYEEKGSMCPPDPSLSYIRTYLRGWSRRVELHNKYNRRCKVSELMEDEFTVPSVSPVPTERTQTPEEALELSIWSPHTTFNLSLLRFCWKRIYV